MPADLIVGTETGDDAAVWRLEPDPAVGPVDRRAPGRALVVTTDFITPVVDDARTWGWIAAANAASDVWAMGGRPLFALNLVAWNSDALGSDLLVEVLAGAADAAREGGWVTVGGHTVEDPEPKFGLAVVGEVDPALMTTNSDVRPGDALVLTKPLGAGVITTAIKRGNAPDDVVGAAIRTMSRLNAAAAVAARAAGATGATDVSGFGFLGHLRKLAEASRVDVDVDVAAVPLLPGARVLAEAGAIPGGTRRNLAWAAERLDAGTTDEVTLLLLADAQTSGGLLFGAELSAAAAAVARLRDDGHDAAVVGTARPGSGRTSLHARGAPPHPRHP